MNKYEVRDRGRVLTFNGLVLAEATSRKDDSPRWTELRLYQTVGGGYVLEKVGRSVVTHMPGCSAARGLLPRFQAAYPGDDPEVGFEYCDCVPDEYDFTKLLVEASRFWALHTTSAAEVIDSLRLRMRGVDNPRIPWVAKSLLDSAALIDAEFGKLWTVQVAVR